MTRVALLMLVTTTGVAAETPAINVHLARCSVTGTDRTCIQNDPILQTSVKDIAGKTPLRPGVGMKGLFKDLRPGSCKSTAPVPPNTSWPARGEAAISFCRP